MQAHLSPLLVVLGPTGAGKSELGLHLAETFDAEIINCDSIQVYRRLDIGSAKVPPAHRRGIYHHLIDVIDPDQELTAGAYSRLAREAISAVQDRGRLPIVVGGTGFYLRALLEGLSPAPPRDQSLRSRLIQVAARRPAALHRFVRRYDAAAAARIHANDRQKLIRAIEIMWLTREPASQTQSLPRNPLSGFAACKIGLNPDRISLYGRLNERSAWMFNNGLLEETQKLLDAGVLPESKPLESLGYKQAVKVLRTQSPIDEAIRECQVATRQYAKRQITWFRREPAVHWLDGFGTEQSVQQQAVELTRAFLASVEASMN